MPTTHNTKTGPGRQGAANAPQGKSSVQSLTSDGSYRKEPPFESISSIGQGAQSGPSVFNNSEYKLPSDWKNAATETARKEQATEPSTSPSPAIADTESATKPLGSDRSGPNRPRYYPSSELEANGKTISFVETLGLNKGARIVVIGAGYDFPLGMRLAGLGFNVTSIESNTRSKSREDICLPIYKKDIAENKGSYLSLGKDYLTQKISPAPQVIIALKVCDDPSIEYPEAIIRKMLTDVAPGGYVVFTYLHNAITFKSGRTESYRDILRRLEIELGLKREGVQVDWIGETYELNHPIVYRITPASPTIDSLSQGSDLPADLLLYAKNTESRPEQIEQRIVESRHIQTLVDFFHRLKLDYPERSKILHNISRAIQSRFVSYPEAASQAVWQLANDSSLSTDELLNLYEVFTFMVKDKPGNDAFKEQKLKDYMAAAIRTLKDAKHAAYCYLKLSLTKLNDVQSLSDQTRKQAVYAIDWYGKVSFAKYRLQEAEKLKDLLFNRDILRFEDSDHHYAKHEITGVPGYLLERKQKREGRYLCAEFFLIPEEKDREQMLVAGCNTLSGSPNDIIPGCAGYVNVRIDEDKILVIESMQGGFTTKSGMPFAANHDVTAKYINWREPMLEKVFDVAEKGGCTGIKLGKESTERDSNNAAYQAVLAKRKAEGHWPFQHYHQTRQ